MFDDGAVVTFWAFCGVYALSFGLGASGRWFCSPSSNGVILNFDDIEFLDGAPSVLPFVYSVELIAALVFKLDLDFVFDLAVDCIPETARLFSRGESTRFVATDRVSEAVVVALETDGDGEATGDGGAESAKLLSAASSSSMGSKVI